MKELSTWHSSTFERAKPARAALPHHLSPASVAEEHDREDWVEAEPSRGALEDAM